MGKNVIEANDARVAEIASAIRAACMGIHGAAEQMSDAQEAVKVLSQGMVVTRISIASQVAALSHDGAWTPAEVKAACDRAAKSGNADDRAAKTVGVFISEMKTFASPKVRARLPDLIEACETAWRDEEERLAECETKEERNAVATPVHKFKTRKYHLILAAARAVKSDEWDIVDDTDVVAWAIANDPDHDEDAVAKRMTVICDTLAKVFDDFGFEPVNTAREYLATITAKELLAARKAKLAAIAASDAERLASHRLAPVPVSATPPLEALGSPHTAPATPPLSLPIQAAIAAVAASERLLAGGSPAKPPAPAPAPAPTPAVAHGSGPRPAEGVFDVDLDVLNDNVELALAS